MSVKDSSAKRPVLDVVFYQTLSGAEPVREWLKKLPAHERQAIGEAIKAVQFRWPLGMLLVRKLTGKVWEANAIANTNCPRPIHCERKAHGALAWVYQKDASYISAGH